MRIAGYLLAAVVVIVAAILITLYAKREALALALADDALAGSGFSVTDLSISRLRPNEIRFRRLLLEHEDGASYDLRDLRVPLSLPDTTVRAAAIGRVLVAPAPAAASEPPPAFGAWLETALNLPARLPHLEVTVGRIEWPGWPDVTDAKWVTGEASQALSAQLAGITVDVQTTRVDAAAHRMSLRALDGTQTLIASDGLDVARAGAGYRIRGGLALDFAPLLALLRDRIALPAGFGAEGYAGAAIDFIVDADGSGALGIDATLDLAPGAKFGYSIADDFAVEATTHGPVQVSAHYPSRDWQLALPSLQVLADHPAAERIEFTVRDVDCTAQRCRLDATGHVRAADFGMAGVAAVQVAGNVSVDFPGAMRVTVSTASLRAENIHGEDWHMGELEFAGDVTLGVGDEWELTAVPASLHARDVRGGDWRLTSLRLAESLGASLHAAPASLGIAANKLELDVGGLAAAGSLSADARVRLEAVSVDMAGPAVAARFELPQDRLRVMWDGLPLVAAGLEGRVDMRGTRGRIRLEASDPARALAARIDVAVAPDRIVATIDDAQLDFSRAPLSASFGDWPHAWDLARGTAHAAGSIEWRTADGALAGSGRVRLADAAGAWDDLAATGIRADIPLTLEAGRAAVVGPALLRVGYLDVGLPLEDLAAAVSWDMARPVLGIADFSVVLLGGTVRAAPFDFDIDRLSGSAVLQVKGIQLGLIPALAEFETVEVTGALSGTVPVAVEEGNVTVAGGRLENEPPGGVIRYHALSAPESGSALGLAQRALSNLQYDSLTSDVTYDEDGDLVMNLRLKGVNPDLDPLQPVILNLNIENNVPQLLESLQATRDIQDVIERRTLKPSAEPPP